MEATSLHDETPMILAAEVHTLVVCELLDAGCRLQFIWVESAPGSPRVYRQVCLHAQKGNPSPSWRENRST